jgi:hypothetical protein
MEISQEKSLYKLLLSQTNKNVMFFFLYFLFCRIGEQKGRTGSAWGEGGGLAPMERGEVAGKESRKVNMMQNMSTQHLNVYLL